jgi:hypothetical protein
MSKLTIQEIIDKSKSLQARIWSFMGMIERLRNGSKMSPEGVLLLAQWQFEMIEFVEIIPISNGNKANMIAMLTKLNLEYPTEYTFHVIDGYFRAIQDVLD